MRSGSIHTSFLPCLTGPFTLVCHLWWLSHWKEPCINHLAANLCVLSFLWLNTSLHPSLLANCLHTNANMLQTSCNFFWDLTPKQVQSLHSWYLFLSSIPFLSCFIMVWVSQRPQIDWGLLEGSAPASVVFMST